MYEQSNTRATRCASDGRPAAGISPLGESDLAAGREDSVAWPRGFAWLDRGQGLALTAGFWIGFVVGRMT